MIKFRPKTEAELQKEAAITADENRKAAAAAKSPAPKKPAKD